MSHRGNKHPDIVRILGQCLVALVLVLEPVECREGIVELDKPPVGIGNEHRVGHAGQSRLQVRPALPEFLFGPLALGDVRIRDDDAFYAVVGGPVGEYIPDVPGAVDTELSYYRCEVVEDRLGIASEVGPEVRLGHIDDGPSDVTGDQLDETNHGRSKAFHPESVIEEDGGDVRAREKIGKVIVRLFLVLDLRLELRIDGGELFVEGLKLFPGGLQLFVRRLELLVRGVKLFVQAFQLLDVALEVLPRRRKLLFELADRGLLHVGDVRGNLLGLIGQAALFPEYDEIEALPQVRDADGHLPFPPGVIRDAHPDGNGFSVLARPKEGTPDPVSHTLRKEIQETRRGRPSGLTQVPACRAAIVKDVVVLIDRHRRGCDILRAALPGSAR